MLDVMTSVRSHQLMKMACLRMGRLTIAGLRQISIGARLEKARQIQCRLPLPAMFEQNSNPKVSSKDYFAPRICALRHASALKCGSFGPKSPFWIPPDISLSRSLASFLRAVPQTAVYRCLPKAVYSPIFGKSHICSIKNKCSYVSDASLSPMADLSCVMLNSKGYDAS